MPMYGPLFRENIHMSPSPSPQVDKFLDEHFERYSSTVMRIPPNIAFDRDHILKQKRHLWKEFIFPISLAIKDRDVYLTAHTSEMGRLKKVAEDLVRADVEVEVLSNLDAETYSTVEGLSQYLIPENLKNTADPVRFDGTSITIKGDRETVSAISSRIQQIIRYHSDPVKGSLQIPKTLLPFLQQNQERRKLSDKFPSVSLSFSFKIQLKYCSKL